MRETGTSDAYDETDLLGLLHFVPAVHNRRMRICDRGRSPLFTERWIADQGMILLVRWCLRFRLGYWDLASTAAEMRIATSP